MIIPDANLIIYAHNEADPDHTAAAAWWRSLLTDAHIAALALEYRAEIHTADLDFGRFPGVRWKNPLALR